MVKPEINRQQWYCWLSKNQNRNRNETRGVLRGSHLSQLGGVAKGVLFWFPCRAVWTSLCIYGNQKNVYVIIFNIHSHAMYIYIYIYVIICILHLTICCIPSHVFFFSFLGGFCSKNAPHQGGQLVESAGYYSTSTARIGSQDVSGFSFGTQATNSPFGVVILAAWWARWITSAT